MRLLNEKTVAKLCHTRHSSREGYLLYQGPRHGHHCAGTNECCAHASTAPGTPGTDKRLRFYFRLCGNLLFQLADSGRPPRGVFLLLGHIVEPGLGADSPSGGDGESDELLSDLSFCLSWPTSSVGGRQHQFTASSSAEAAMWVRALIAASVECTVSTADELIGRLKQLTADELDNGCGSDKNAASVLDEALPQTRRNPFNCEAATPPLPVDAEAEFSEKLTSRLDAVLAGMAMRADDLAQRDAQECNVQHC